jgi:hypothetical protein
MIRRSAPASTSGSPAIATGGASARRAASSARCSFSRATAPAARVCSVRLHSGDNFIGRGKLAEDFGNFRINGYPDFDTVQTDKLRRYRTGNAEKQLPHIAIFGLDFLSSLLDRHKLARHRAELHFRNLPLRRGQPGALLRKRRTNAARTRNIAKMLNVLAPGIVEAVAVHRLSGDYAVIEQIAKPLRAHA